MGDTIKRQINILIKEKQNKILQLQTLYPYLKRVNELLGIEYIWETERQYNLQILRLKLDVGFYNRLLDLEKFAVALPPRHEKIHYFYYEGIHVSLRILTGFEDVMVRIPTDASFCTLVGSYSRALNYNPQSKDLKKVVEDVITENFALLDRFNRLLRIIYAS